MASIIVLDIDDTIVKTDSTYIGIVKFKNGEKYRLSTEEFAKDPDKSSKNVKYVTSEAELPEDPDPDTVYYSYQEFNDKKKIRKSIYSGKPLIKNLKIMDHFVNKGWKVCFLTARSQEDYIKKLLASYLKYRTKEGELKHLGDHFNQEDSRAVNDIKYAHIFKGLNDPEKKAAILEYLCSKYEKVIFIDDDMKNITAAKVKNIPNLKVIKALTENMSEDQYDQAFHGRFDPLEQQEWNLPANVDDVDGALDQFFRDEYFPDNPDLTEEELSDIIRHAYWSGHTSGFNNAKKY